MKILKISRMTLSKIAGMGALLTLAYFTTVSAQNGSGKSGEEIANSVCATCHDAGAAGAPKTGQREDWAARLEQGDDVLIEHAIAGFNAMPPKGGDMSLTDDEVRRAVVYMLALVRSADSAGNTAATEENATANQAVTTAPEAVAQSDNPPPQAAEPMPKQDTAAVQADTKQRAQVAAVNTFNRLMKPPNQRNPAPAKDGIHDPAIDATNLLQPPAEAFNTLPKGQSGNYIDWVLALEDGHIAPWFDLEDANAQPVLMDLNIVREVKGSMPDVVYPHKQHTEWLDCSNCHPAIFTPKKGDNQISMAAILLGEKCGVCHGKVAFPVSDCRRCHARKKGDVTTAAGG
jgi:c(7)-type cytochrome triheme protein